MAIGILGAMGTVAALDRHLFIGELSLDGALRPVRLTVQPGPLNGIEGR